MEPATVVIGIPWYRAEDWSTLKAMFPDGDQLHATHARWLAEAEKVEKRLSREGHQVKRVTLEPSVFRSWCLLRGLAMDASARTHYASEQVQRDDKVRPFDIAP